MNRILLVFLIACHDDKPIVTPNPGAADCIVDRTKAQLDCVKDNDSGAAADKCIADVKAKQECVDGGGSR